MRLAREEGREGRTEGERRREREEGGRRRRKEEVVVVVVVEDRRRRRRRSECCNVLGGECRMRRAGKTEADSSQPDKTASQTRAGESKERKTTQAGMRNCRQDKTEGSGPAAEYLSRVRPCRALYLD